MNVWLTVVDVVLFRIGASVLGWRPLEKFDPVFDKVFDVIRFSMATYMTREASGPQTNPFGPTVNLNVGYVGLP